MKLHLLDNGVLLLGKENPVLLDRNEAETSNDIPVHSFLLDTSIGYILFDCACDDEGMKVWPEWLKQTPYQPGENGTVVDSLRKIGIQPEEIKYVVLSHMHVDHMGCLKYFPAARTLVSAEEFISVMKNYATDQLTDTFHVKTDIENSLKAGIRWQLMYEESMQICDEVTVYHLGPGHSYGMLALLVKGENGNYILASDAVYSKAHYGPPAQMAGVCIDEAGYYRTIEKIRAISEVNNAEVFFGHDMNQFKELQKRYASGTL